MSYNLCMYGMYGMLVMFDMFGMSFYVNNFL